MVSLLSSEVEPILRLDKPWWHRALPEHVDNSDDELFQRYRRIPPPTEEWAQADGLSLDPSMLSPAEFQPSPWAPESEPAWHGLVAFNTLPQRAASVSGRDHGLLSASLDRRRARLASAAGSLREDPGRLRPQLCRPRCSASSSTMPCTREVVGTFDSKVVDTQYSWFEK